MSFREGRSPLTVSAVVRHVARRDVGFVAVLVGGAVLTAAPVAFMWTYMLNDAIGWDDHVDFLSMIGVVASATALVGAVWLRLSSRQPWRHALAGSVLVGVAVLCAFGAAYAGLSMLPALDSAVGESASNWVCLAWLVGLAAAGAAAFVGGQRLLSKSP